MYPQNRSSVCFSVPLNWSEASQEEEWQKYIKKQYQSKQNSQIDKVIYMDDEATIDYQYLANITTDIRASVDSDSSTQKPNIATKSDRGELLFPFRVVLSNRYLDLDIIHANIQMIHQTIADNIIMYAANGNGKIHW